MASKKNSVPAAQGGLIEITAGADIMDAMRSELNRGVMVAWINADLMNRADCDVRKSVVLYDESRVFVMALGAEITPDLWRKRLIDMPKTISAIHKTGIRYWSVGIA